MDLFTSILAVNNSLDSKINDVVTLNSILEDTLTFTYSEEIPNYVNLSELDFTILIVKNDSGQDRGIFVGPGSEPTSSNQIVQKYNG